MKAFKRVCAAVFGADLGLVIAWGVIDTPTPLPLIPRLAGYVFFVGLFALGGYVLADAA